jgi:mRNA-degrading endonuclease RelE of RelBE toxin-antitoxin system
VVIAETSTFSRRVDVLLDAESYRLLQLELIAHPGKGRLISGTGGIRKLRWAGSGRGKRGGVRVIYYWAAERDIVLLLLIYPKNVQDDLSADQKRLLRQVVEKEFS